MNEYLERLEQAIEDGKTVVIFLDGERIDIYKDKERRWIEE